MNTRSKETDDLEQLARFLRWAKLHLADETASPESAQEHLPEEAFVDLSLGNLESHLRPSTVEHLAQCEQCREQAAEMIAEAEAMGFVQWSDEEENEEEQKQKAPQPSSAEAEAPSVLPRKREPGTSGRRRSVLSICAVAAAILVMVALLLRPGGPDPAGRIRLADAAFSKGQVAEALTTLESLSASPLDAQLREQLRSVAERHGERLLGQKQFDYVGQLNQQVAKAGVTSTRLDVITAQSLLGHDRLLALDSKPGLSDYGYGQTPSGSPGSKAIDPSLEAGNAQAVVQAIQLLSAACERAPDDREARLNYGHVLLLNNKFTKAAKQFNHMIDVDPNDRQAWLGLGLSAYISGDYEQAVKNFQRVLELGPEDDKVVRANLEMARRRLQESESGA